MDNLNPSELQDLCEAGQRFLIETRYWESVQALVKAEEMAWQLKDFDTLARLYMPLQEARRQIRQKAGEGNIQLDLISRAAHTPVELPASAVGQFLIAGWGTIQPALDVRKDAFENGKYRETFLAAAYPVVGGSIAVVVVPMKTDRLPEPAERTIDALLQLIPPFSLAFHADELPKGIRKGNTQTYGETMALWEKLHAPFLAAADAEVTPIRKMEGYRKTIHVDSACELAHQKLSDLAKQMKHRR